MTEQFLSQLVTTFTGKTPNAVQSTFIKIDEQWAIKVYRTEKKRDQCYANQQMMEPHGYGPNTGIKFNVGEKFCYITEVVETINLDRMSWDEEYEYREEMKKLLANMLEKGFEMDDPHSGNIGRKSGKLVCIDFGLEDWLDD